MKVHIFQHVPYESPGCISDWAVLHQHELEKTCFFEHWVSPDLSDVDLLIVVGGPMSVHDVEEHPWLIPEKEMLRDFINTGRPVLGICLGAQLIADVLGANVYGGDYVEIGWFDVKRIQNEVPCAFAVPESFEVFHWHGDTFDLPEGATHLLKSAGCQHQAFQIGQQVFGLQFHLEITQEGIEELVANCSEELVDGKYIQHAVEILKKAPDQLQDNNRLLCSMLDYLEKNYHKKIKCRSCLVCS